MLVLKHVMQELAKRAGAILLCTVLLVAAPARAQGDLQQIIAEAESLYVRGQFDDPAPLLSYPLVQADTQEAVAAYRLLALYYLEHQAAMDAEFTVLRLLYRAPQYQADSAEDPPGYVALVSDVRRLVEAPVHADATCSKELSEAGTLYTEGNFDAATTALSQCLNRYLIYLPKSEYLPALRLLALLHLKQGDLQLARSTVDQLLKLEPAYRMDPLIDPPDYVALVGLVRALAAN